jgi:arylformamidase
VLVFVHGGYWRALDKGDHSFIAPPFVAQGACVVVPNYTLCPAVRVSDITRQMVAAVAWVWQHIAEHGGDPDRITVVGHSAGGQLVGMLLATDWLAVGHQLGVVLPAQPLQHGVSISGLFDMEPIRQTPFLADLGLTPEEAASQSPAKLSAPQRPGRRGRLTTVVGGDESDEFKRQNQLIQQAWGPNAVPVCEELPGLNHFSVVEELVKPGSRLNTLVAACMGEVK